MEVHRISPVPTAIPLKESLISAERLYRNGVIGLRFPSWAVCGVSVVTGIARLSVNVNGTGLFS